MEEKIKAFERSAETYEEWYATPAGAYALKAELKALRELLPETGLGAEIGSGTGIFAKNLTTDNRTILCVEPSTQMIQLSKSKNLLNILGVAEEPPLKIRCLDFIYLVTVLEFLLDPFTALSSLGKLLKPDAALLVLAINRESPWGQAYTEASKRNDSVFMYSHIYTIKEAMTLLKSAGYLLTGALMALETAPDQSPTREPEIYDPQELRNGGIFVLKGLKKQSQGARLQVR